MTDDYGNNIFETIKITLVSAPRTHDAFPCFPTPPRVCHRSATTASRPVRNPIPTHPHKHDGFTHSRPLACVAVFADHPEKCVSFDPPPQRCALSHACPSVQVSAQAGVHAQAHSPHYTSPLPRVCVGRLPSPQPLQMAVLQEGRDGALQRAQTVPNRPALYLTP